MEFLLLIGSASVKAFTLTTKFYPALSVNFFMSFYFWAFRIVF